jgi:tetratricopeptide (TPR) repeat protein/WD40 repeat protein
MSSGQNDNPAPNGNSENGADTLLSELLKAQEVAWSGGQPISIEQLLTQLPKTGPQMEATLDLVSNEVGLREFAGELPQLSDYQQRFPEVAAALQVQWEIDRLVDEGVELDAEDAQSLDRIGRYQIQDEVGRGAMGVVYRAWDPTLKRVVAIKRLRAGFDATKTELLRIRTEAEAVARIHHDNVVQIHDIGEHQGYPFLAMEFCSGGSLATRLQSHALSIKPAAELMIKISDGVAAAHAANVLHRDLKPANVLLKDETSWHPKVSDFGLAKQTDGDDGATATGTLLGSPAYMAPEQAFGHSDQIGRAADIYAMGAILYECLTGRPPFRGVSVADTLEQVKNREPVPVRQLNPQVPQDLETITHKCLRKEPNHRYASAGDLALDLGRFLRKEPIHAKRETALQAIQRTFRRYPMASSLATTTVALLLLITIGSLVAAKQLNTKRLEAEQAKREARLAQADALIGRAEGIRRSRRPGQRFEALKAIREAVAIGRELDQPEEWFTKLRGEAISALLLPDAHLEYFHREEAEIQSASFSPDRRRYAIALKDQAIQIRDTNSHRVVATVERSDAVGHCFFIGNDRLLIGNSPSRKFEMWSLESASPRRVWQNEGGCHDWLTQFSFTPCRKRMAVANDREFRVIELDTGKVLATHPVAPFTREAKIAIHPTHPNVALATYHQSKIQIRNWQTGDLVFESANNSEGGRATSVDWSPDGRTLVAPNDHGLCRYQFDPEHETVLPLEPLITDSANGNGTVIRFNDKGDHLLSWGWGNYLAIIEYGSGRLIMKSEAVNRLSNSWDSDEFWAGFCLRNDQLQAMSLAVGREYRLLNFSDQNQCRGNLAIDPEGNFLVTFQNQHLKVLNARTFETLAQLQLPGVARHSLHLDSEGEIFLSSTATHLRWPFRIVKQKDTVRLEIVLPRRTHLPDAGLIWTAASRNGQVVAAGVWNGYGAYAHAGAWLKTAIEPAPRKMIGDGSGTICTVSPDGQYALIPNDITGCLEVDCSAHPLKAQSITRPSFPKFSKTGTWWINDKQRIRSGIWKAETEFNSDSTVIDISSDGRYLLEQDPAGVLGVYDAELKKPVAHIDLPSPLQDAQFAPEGDRIFCDTQEEGIGVINLRLVRDQLQELGLDWEAPQFPEQTKPVRLEASFSKEVDQIKTLDELLEKVDQAALQRAQADLDDGFAAFDAAMASLRNRQMDQALELLERAVEHLPESITPRQWRAFTRAYQRDYLGAIEDADWVLARIEDGELQLQRAEWLFRVGKHESAVAGCTAVIQARPILAGFVYGLRSQIYREMGKVTEADADHQEFLKLTPNDAASLNLAIAPYVGKDLSLRRCIISLLLAEKMLSLGEQLSTLQLKSIGFAYYRNDRFDKAISYFEQCLAQLNESDEDQDIRGMSQLGLAMAQHQLGKTELSRQTLERAQQWKPRINTPTPLVREEMHVLRAEAMDLIDR